jgi:glucose-6-phosphate 1-dehydrogenase
VAGNESPRPDNHVVAVFGATGHLAKRKLLPCGSPKRGIGR